MRKKSHAQPFAKRSLGQNFLVDRDVVAKIIGAFDAGEDDVVVEIGPGRGALTEHLVHTAGRVVVIEFDNHLAALLRQKFPDAENFEIIEGDVLAADFDEIASGGRLRLIANLPYNISTAVLQKLFDHRDVLSDCVLMFQREVADRITAQPGSKDRGYLTVLTEAYFDITHLFDVSPGAFLPPPKVWSSVIRLVPSQTVVSRPHELRALVAAGFAQKRKTIANNLKTFSPSYAAALEKAAIDPGRRAETLGLNEWLRLEAAFHNG